jgi:hypothetical protein
MAPERTPELQILDGILRRLSWKLRLRRLVRWTTAGLWQVLAIGVVILVIGRLRPVPNLTLWWLAPMAIWMILAATGAMLWPLPQLEVARQLDYELALKDRVSTATTLAGTGRHSAMHFDSHLVDRQRRDAVDTLQSLDLRRTFLPRLNARGLWVASGLLIAALVLAATPNPMAG